MEHELLNIQTIAHSTKNVFRITLGENQFHHFSFSFLQKIYSYLCALHTPSDILHLYRIKTIKAPTFQRILCFLMLVHLNYVKCNR